jgi:hypothetical protein
VRLDTARHRLEGWGTIRYRSGADTALTAIHLHAYPNAFSHANTLYSREAARQGEDWSLRYAKPDERGWMAIDSVTADGAAAAIRIDETLATIALPRPLQPGDSVALTMRFAAQVPKHFDRFGRTGDAYSIAQWYPKVAVYDEEGWHADPFHYLAEFYGDFATFDVAITLPDDFWVGATGVPAGAEGGDNEIPLLEEETPRDSVSVSFRVATADTLEGRWPAGLLWVETDLPRDGEGDGDGNGGDPSRSAVPRGGAATLRVPRGAPVHYAYLWGEGAMGDREEADEEGRPRPLRLLRAFSDTTVLDTVRALAPDVAPGGTLLPSLKTLRFHADRVHDFAWVASPDYVRGDTAWAGVAVRALVFREDQDRWRGLKARTVDALRHFGDLAGPYRWPQLTSAEAYCGGGAMEYNMLVMNEPEVYSRHSHDLDDTNAHEVAHSWFYGMVASDERAHPWLDEGFAQYLSDDYTDSRHPRGLFAWAARFPWLTPRSAFTADETAYLARAWARDERPMSTAAEGFASYRDYDAASYSKAVCMLRTLRGVVGDSAFAAFLRRHVAEQTFRHPRPADVIRAAEEASGRDLEDFFRGWLDTTDRAGFALGDVRSERAEGGYRSTVTVRRTERMVLPVPVDARFADGTRQEMRVLTRDPITPVTFESRARLVGATLDPRHELVEMNRLDNRTGFLPPMRLRPLFDFPQTDEITVLYGPTLWHGRAEGARIGAWADGRYLPSRDFPEGILRFHGGLSVGSRDGSVAWRLGAMRRVEALGARGSVVALAANDAGLFRVEAAAGNWATAPGRLHPWKTWTVGVQYRDRDAMAPIDPRYWSPGRTLNATASLVLETVGPRHEERIALSLRRGASAFRSDRDRAPDAQYDRVRFEARQTLDVIPDGSVRLAWRLAAGSAWRRVPRELLFDVAEASRLDGLDHFYQNDRGPLRASGRYLAEGGGGLRGFAGRAVLGKRLLALDLEASHAAVPVHAFAGLGRVEASGLGEPSAAAPHPLVGRTLADAGLGADIGPVRLLAPFWVSRPEPDESPWGVRWLLSLDLAGLHPWW